MKLDACQFSGVGTHMIRVSRGIVMVSYSHLPCTLQSVAYTWSYEHSALSCREAVNCVIERFLVGLMLHSCINISGSYCRA